MFANRPLKVMLVTFIAALLIVSLAIVSNTIHPNPDYGPRTQHGLVQPIVASNP